MNSEEPTRRDRIAYHEAGHALAGTLIYGTGFVVKAHIKPDRTTTNFQTMGLNPKHLWQGGRLVQVRSPSGFDALDALGIQSLAGMAADNLAHTGYLPGTDDVEGLNAVILDGGYDFPVIEPSQKAFDSGLLSQDPYVGWFMSATELLQEHRSSLEAIAGWLKKTDTLQGHEVEMLISGDVIREGGE